MTTDDSPMTRQANASPACVRLFTGFDDPDEPLLSATKLAGSGRQGAVALLIMEAGMENEGPALRAG